MLDSPDSSPVARPRRIIVGISGASGALYSVRTIELLAAAGVEVHVAVTTLGKRLLWDELGIKKPDGDALSRGHGANVVMHNDRDLGATIASGSYVTDGMIIVPASSNTLGAVSAGITDNLVQRAAMVTMKERRRLIIAHRESPLTLIDIRNMELLTLAGAVIAPCNPGLYMLPKSIDDIVDMMAGKFLDLLGVHHDLPVRWSPRESRTEHE